ncbi:NADH-quinone oxidoreductase subunit NuoK [Desulfuromonas acetoxidans]|uniref:NADH-quinone oxidoreductase subunit K n=1 Tax=Desulfuromonas acetoxidans (strain DSM 684 / 11070) TaxID=281689 RepID=Q1K3U5_DESA6|nr:NADH-quinone oxidoreductase subunit NuoK [Desulfuromonas acetoxidans]EAT17358.1 NADH-ubiquinone oxidoreductase, chain 4L [Desulfuromonas acetoxidans DSM 684]MBF0644259.1 NADH-quinone oxidoreductase subunit NuoK [Desulfuromonas acetoxidans]NVD24871.1 NADH-quinone oxidoreductase subunit NuoK [Desulfuromonas acetoxidans]NVE15172.1 NADH-quinone oxidoreductase subunit NuoK [Desulfuromonas acetoxidans]
MITITHYMVLSAILFSMGTIGVLTRKNAIVVFMCVELMLNAVNLTFIALSSHLGNMDGQIFVFFIMTVAAAEAAVGLALMIAFFRNRESIDVEDFSLLKW